MSDEMSDICSAMTSPPEGEEVLITDVRQTDNLLECSDLLRYFYYRGIFPTLKLRVQHLDGFSDIICERLLWYMQHAIVAGLQKKDHSGIREHSLRHQPDDCRDHVLSLVFL